MDDRGIIIGWIREPEELEADHDREGEQSEQRSKNRFLDRLLMGVDIVVAGTTILVVHTKQ